MRTKQIKRQKSNQNEGVNKIETNFFDLNSHTHKAMQNQNIIGLAHRTFS